MWVIFFSMEVKKIKILIIKIKIHLVEEKLQMHIITMYNRSIQSLKLDKNATYLNP